MERYVILLGGEAPAQLARPEVDVIVAADGGGYRHARRWGWEPDRIVGDFDSIDTEGLPEIVEQRYMPDQDSTDFEKVLLGLGSPSFARVDVYGGLGGRADHHHTNLLIAAGLPRSWVVVLHGAAESMTRVTSDRHFESRLAGGETLSLLPFCRVGSLVATGLKWPLSNVEMGIGSQLGQSNETLGGAVKVSLGSGVLWVWRAE